MDFDGFLLQMRIEVEAVQRASAPLWEQAEAADSLPAADEQV